MDPPTNEKIRKSFENIFKNHLLRRRKRKSMHACVKRLFAADFANADFANDDREDEDEERARTYVRLEGCRSEPCLFLLCLKKIWYFWENEKIFNSEKFVQPKFWWFPRNASLDSFKAPLVTKLKNFILSSICDTLNKWKTKSKLADFDLTQT